MDHSIAQFHTQPTFKATSLSSHFLLSLHLNHLMITLQPAWIQKLIQAPLYITLFPNLITPISRPLTNLTTPNPARLHFPNLPFNLSTPNLNLNRFPYIFYLQCNTHIFPLTSEYSDNNSSVNSQISHELDNFITLQQQLKHPQTLTFHQLSQSKNTQG